MAPGGACPADAYGDLGSFGLAGMVRLSAALRELSVGCTSVAGFAQQVCEHLHRHLLDEGGKRQTVLVRFYGTASFGSLPPQERSAAGREVSDDTACLVLLGTVGEQQAWNDRTRSVGHRVLPLTDVEEVERLPMVAALLHQLGIHLPALVTSQGQLLRDVQDESCGIFHVPRAQYSPLVPDQQFVAEYGVESVLGFGGALPTGEVYAVVLFADVPVPAEAAQLFETVALSTTMAALELLDVPLLPGGERAVPHPLTAEGRSTARQAASAALLRVHQRLTLSESEAAAASLERITMEVQRYAALATRLRLAQDAAQLGLWDWEPVTGALVWDDHCTHLFGASVAELTGHLTDFDSRCDPEDLPKVHGQLAHVLATGDDLELEYRVVFPDRTVRRHLSRGHVVRDASGAVVRLIGAVLDVTDLRAAADARSRLASVALRLARASTVEEVNKIVIEDGFAALGAAGGGLVLRSHDGVSVDVTLSDFYDGDLGRQVATVPIDFDVPSVHTARTGEASFHGDLASQLEAFPGEPDVLRAAKVEAAASLPLRVRDRLLGSLTATWIASRVFAPGEIELLEGLAAQCAQALDRVMAEESERRAIDAVRSMSETLQRSMLTSPPEPPGLEVVVRYRSAARELEIGGDWYDAFVTAEGATCLVVGDVTGHDRDAAATMGQVRNLLRAAAYTSSEGPASVLDTLERTMDGLQVSALATVILASLRPAAEDGSRLLRWCNAGHLPPVLLLPGGVVEVLEGEPDLVLGMLVGADRAQHESSLPTGATLLLYTDGLVERRGEHLDEGITRLVQAVRRLGNLPVQELCDVLLSDLVPGGAEDDVALLAVRVLPSR